jgi:hypothetical protein
MLTNISDRKIVLTLGITIIVFMVLLISFIICSLIFPNPIYRLILDCILLTGNFIATIACGASTIVIHKRRKEIDTKLFKLLMIGIIFFFFVNASMFFYHSWKLIMS